MKKIVATQYNIVSDKLPEVFDGSKVVMLSDLHDNVYGIDLNRLYEMVDANTPELVIVAGDLLTRKKSNGSDEVVALLRRIATKYPVFFANGNHETKVNTYRDRYNDRYDRLMADLKDAGVFVLNNKSMDYRKGDDVIHIHGLEIGIEYVKVFNRPDMPADYVSGLIGEAKDGFNLLIAHNPMFFDNYAAWGADLTLSGHVHGGIVRLPFLGGVLNPDYRLFPKYDAGEYHIGQSEMILGRGLGTHTINARINNPPELVVVTLNRN